MNPSIVQLRGTVFMPISIGYNEENAKKIRDFLPGGQIQPLMPVSQETIIRSEMRLGEPWQIVKNGRSITFNYTRVDIVEIRTDDQIETENRFVQYCTDTFSKLLKDVGYYTRIAYSPTFAMDEIGDFNCNRWWNTMIANSDRTGYVMQERNLTFLLDKNVQIGDKNVILNMHHKMFDGYKYDKNQIKINDSIIITLDLNTAEVEDVKLKENEIISFFQVAMEEKDFLIKKYLEI